ncbi:hypothetical protein [Stenotrophomonas phage CM2]
MNNGDSIANDMMKPVRVNGRLMKVLPDSQRQVAGQSKARLAGYPQAAGQRKGEDGSVGGYGQAGTDSAHCPRHLRIQQLPDVQRTNGCASRDEKDLMMSIPSRKTIWRTKSVMRSFQ